MKWSDISEWIHLVLEYEIFSLGKFSFTVWKLALLAIIFGITWFIVRVIRFVMRKRMSQMEMDSGTASAFIQLVKYFLYSLGVIIAMESIGIKINILLASSAALLVGIGFGLQQIFYDLVSGILLLFEGTIRVDDVVEINQDLIGRVKKIGLRTSKIETRDDTYVIVPNSKFISGDVVNWSHIRTSTRFRITVGVAYGSDVEKVRISLLDAAKDQKEVSRMKKPFVRFDDFGDSALIFHLFFWTDETFGVENLKSDIRFRIDQLFRENGIVIPFPQRDLHLKSGSFSKSE